MRCAHCRAEFRSDGCGFKIVRVTTETCPFKIYVELTVNLQSFVIVNGKEVSIGYSPKAFHAVTR